MKQGSAKMLLLVLLIVQYKELQKLKASRILHFNLTMQETDIIDKIIYKKAKVKNVHAGCLVGLGDDAEMLDVTNIDRLVIASDALVEGVHFPTWASIYSIGYKLAAVNLSDFAACNASPRWASLNLLLSGANQNWLDQFFAGLYDCLDAFDTKLIGGDTCHSKTNCFSLTLIGESNQFIARSKAKEGDLIYLSHSLGAAALALKIGEQEILKSRPKSSYKSRNIILNRVALSLLEALEKPQPKIDYAAKIAKYASSMIDVSDSLLIDLCRLLKNSSATKKHLLGAHLALDEKKILCDDFNHYFNQLALSNSILKMDPKLSFACTAGDGYELLFTLPKNNLEKAQQDWSELNSPPIYIGTITSQGKLMVNQELIIDSETLHAGGKCVVPQGVSQLGFEHSF